MRGLTSGAYGRLSSHDGPRPRGHTLASHARCGAWRSRAPGGGARTSVRNSLGPYSCTTAAGDQDTGAVERNLGVMGAWVDARTEVEVR